MKLVNEHETISIIVPIYNVEKFLNTCIYSVINQTYPNLEIILVDDGSYDNSAKLCEELSLVDCRIVVVHKKNGGQAQARNKGIQLANGDYIGFVDSDDVIHPQMYEILHDLLFQNGADTSECSYQVFEKWPLQDFLLKKDIIKVFQGQEIIKECLSNQYITQTVWNMLVKSNIAKQVKFDVGKVHEDILWPYRVFRECSRVVVTSQKLYGYYQRPGSTMNTQYSIRRFDALDATKTRAEEIKQDFPQLYHQAEETYLGLCLYHCQLLCRLDRTPEYNSFFRQIHKRFCNGGLSVVIPTLNTKYKIWYSMFYAFPKLTCKLRNRLKIGL